VDGWMRGRSGPKGRRVEWGPGDVGGHDGGGFAGISALVQPGGVGACASLQPGRNGIFALLQHLISSSEKTTIFDIQLDAY